MHALKCEHNRDSLLHALALLEYHHQGVLISVKVMSFELDRHVRHGRSLTQSLASTHITVRLETQENTIS